MKTPWWKHLLRKILFWYGVATRQLVIIRVGTGGNAENDKFQIHFRNRKTKKAYYLLTLNRRQLEHARQLR